MDELEKALQSIPGYDPHSSLFGLGTVHVTDAARETLTEAYGSDDLAQVEPYLARHRAAEWQDLSEHERQMNLSAMEGGHEIRGRFPLPGVSGKKLLVVTAEEGPRRRRPSTTVDAEES